MSAIKTSGFQRVTHVTLLPFPNTLQAIDWIGKTIRGSVIIYQIREDLRIQGRMYRYLRNDSETAGKLP